MAKRVASSQLTADNWQDEVVDEAGSFTKADEAEMRARLIKKAKRSTGNLSSGGIFSGIKFSSNASDSTSHVSTSNTEDDYLHQLECLNTSVAEWISQHVQRNPLVDLTPIFRDYEAYLKSLDQKRKQLNKDSVTITNNTKPASLSTLPIITEAVQASSHSEVIVSESNGSSDHVMPSVNVAITTTVEDVSQDSEDDDAPIIVAPKPPADQPVKDDDSLLAVRSKLFYKKADSYVELGVGILRVKEEQSKAILIMRNDTKLANILLNVSLSSQLPVSRAGKNNVLLMCPPNPPLDLKPTNQNEEASQPATGEIVTYLIRVKTKELADQLFELIKKLQCKLS